MLRILSWNVNGIRAVTKKGFLDWLSKESPDILCLQETKAHPDQLVAELTEPTGYHTYFSSAEKKGYSGVAIYSRVKPREVFEMGIDRFDNEGRVLQAHFDDFVLITCYFPNSQDQGKRLDYKLDFCANLHTLCREFDKQGVPTVVCGDYNIAHQPIDLARPKENEGSAGYLPEERAWMSEFLESGYHDTFRLFEPDGGHYTWWSYVTRGRERNVGWRLDYHCVNDPCKPLVQNAGIMPEVMGSDHCPVSVDIEFGRE
jgi:exodeoxyribonuclease-3